MNDRRALLDALRAAVGEGRLPGAAVRAELAQADDPVLLRKAGAILAGLPAADPADPADPGAAAVRVAVLATYTVGPLEHLLRATLVGAGALPAIQLAGYRTFDLTLATGDLAGQDLVACTLDESYFLPADWTAARPDALAEHVHGRLAELRGLVTAALRRTTATLVLHTVPLPPEVLDTHVSLRARAAVARAWHELNAGLLALATEHPQVVTVDLVSALADGPYPARDHRLHRYADMPYTDGALLLLAREIRRVAQARAGLSRKVLALDLDNTLWGGVLGELGAHGVQLGGLYPGNCYQGLQRTVRRLREQGVILVLASKNDAALVTEALTGHPEMLLRPEAFSVTAVNWSSKAENLRAAAASLGLGTQSFVFMDDSAFERGLIARELPEVAVVAADGDPAHLVHALLRHGWFDVLELTETDRERPALYRSRAMRDDFSTGFGSSQDYLRALGIEVVAERVTGYSVARVAQLAARTNQFNLTGRRYDEASTAVMSTDPDHLVAAFEVSDRFGEEGIVGALWVDCATDGTGVWRVLNLVLSCRVLGRGVELAMAAWLAGQARAAGAGTLRGEYVRSAKNGVSGDFWRRAGFTETGGTGSGDLYELALDGATPEIPDWITIHDRSGVPT